MAPQRGTPVFPESIFIQFITQFQLFSLHLCTVGPQIWLSSSTHLHFYHPSLCGWCRHLRFYCTSVFLSTLAWLLRFHQAHSILTESSFFSVCFILFMEKETARMQQLIKNQFGTWSWLRYDHIKTILTALSSVLLLNDSLIPTYRLHYYQEFSFPKTPFLPPHGAVSCMAGCTSSPQCSDNVSESLCCPSAANGKLNGDKYL